MSARERSARELFAASRTVEGAWIIGQGSTPEKQGNFQTAGRARVCAQDLVSVAVDDKRLRVCRLPPVPMGRSRAPKPKADPAACVCACAVAPARCDAGGNGPPTSRTQLCSVEIVEIAGGSQKDQSSRVAVNASPLGEHQVAGRGVHNCPQPLQGEWTRKGSGAGREQSPLRQQLPKGLSRHCRWGHAVELRVGAPRSSTSPRARPVAGSDTAAALGGGECAVGAWPKHPAWLGGRGGEGGRVCACDCAGRRRA